MTQTWTMQPPEHTIKHIWRNPLPVVDNPGGDFRDGEVRAMNLAHRNDWREWQEEHQ